MGLVATVIPWVVCVLSNGYELRAVLACDLTARALRLMRVNLPSPHAETATGEFAGNWLKGADGAMTLHLTKFAAPVTGWCETLHGPGLRIGVRILLARRRMPL